MSLNVLCIDIGTSSLKGAVISEEGKLISSGRIFYDERGALFHDTETAIWKQALKKLIAFVGTASVSALSVSSNGPSIVPVGERGRVPHDKTFLWFDEGEEHIHSGRSLFLPKILWFKNHRKEDYEKTKYFLSPDGFFNYLLTGKPSVSVISKRFLPFFWTDKEIDEVCLNIKKFPPAVFTGNFIGEVTAEAGKEYNLKPGLPVFAGGSDFLMAILGTCSLAPGEVCDRAGTSEGINYCSEKNHTFKNFRTMPHITGGCYNISGLLPFSGNIFEWFRRISNQEKRDYKDIMSDIEKVILKDNSLCFFPPSKKRGSCGSSEALFTGLKPTHGKAERGGAVVKSIGFAARRIISEFESKGLKIDTLRISGGQAKNHTWNKIKADITGKKILIPEIEDGELTGCACAAFTGLGIFKSINEAAYSIVKIKKEYLPDREAHDIYSGFFKNYSAESDKISNEETNR